MMPIPGPHDGDTRDDHPMGKPTNRPAAPGKDKYGDDVWTEVTGKPGYYVNRAGRLKYDPSKDPQHPLFRR